MEILFLIFIFSFYVFIKNIKNTKLLFLSITLITFSIYAIAHLSVNSEGYSFLKTLLYNHLTPFYLLAGPSYYFFVRMSLDSEFKLSYKNAIHLMPFAIQLVGIVPYILIPWEEKHRLVNALFYNPELQLGLKTNAFFSTFFNYFFRLFHLLFYLIWAIMILKKNNIEAAANDKKLKTFSKISIILIGIIVFYYVHIGLIIYKESFTNWGVKTIIYIDLILLVLLLRQFIKYPELYIQKSKIKSSYLLASPFIEQSNSVNNLTILTKDNEIIQDRVLKLIDERTFFIDPKNNFQEFSNQIRYPDYIIRHFLKSKGTSYIDIKNNVRISVAKELLNKTKLTYNLNYIAEKSGFNSQSNFFKIFKKYEKCTPGEYLK